MQSPSQLQVDSLLLKDVSLVTYYVLIARVLYLMHYFYK